MDPEAPGIAQSATEHVNVGIFSLISDENSSYNVLQSHSRPVVSYYFPKGVGEYHYGVNLFFLSIFQHKF